MSTEIQNPQPLSIGQLCGALTKVRGLTQKEVANYVKRDRVSINRFFNGHSQPPADVFLLLLNFLGIDMQKQIADALQREVGSAILK